MRSRFPQGHPRSLLARPPNALLVKPELGNEGNLMSMEVTLESGETTSELSPAEGRMRRRKTDSESALRLGCGPEAALLFYP